MQTKNETPATVLGTLMPEVKDCATLQEELCYRDFLNEIHTFTTLSDKKPIHAPHPNMKMH